MRPRPLLPLLLSATVLLQIAPARAADDEEAALADLLEVLEEETELATKTRLNSDFVPGLVSVLDGETLAAQGVRTVWEALAQVPGVETSLDERGTPTVTVRGIAFPFNSGSVQILLNGVPTGREAAGVNSSAMFIPITQVERIEFIRGPGSVLYGDFAFQGLLNILTRQEGTRASVEVDSEGAFAAHWLGGRRDDAGNGVSLDVAALQGDDLPLPADREGDDRRWSGLLSAQAGAFTLTGNLFGRNLDSPLIDGIGGDFDERSLALELRHVTHWSETLETRSRVQWLDSHLEKPIIDFRADQLEIGSEIYWRGWTGHDVLFGLEWQTNDLERGAFRDGQSSLLPPIPARVVTDSRRENQAVFVQDQIALGDTLMLTAGLRWDDVEQIGSRVTPRLSAVWQFRPGHILKAQVAEGFRGATFFELAGAEPIRPLDFEVNRTSELTWIWRQPQRTLRATAFVADIDDMVFLTFPRLSFANVASARAQGVELEWSQQLRPDLKLDAQLSWSDARDNRNPFGVQVDSTSNPDWLGHLGLLWQPGSRDLVALRLQAIGDRVSAGSYQRLGLSWTRQRFLHADVDLQLAVQNLTDERTVYVFPGPLGDVPLAVEDRTAWLRLGWRMGH